MAADIGVLIVHGMGSQEPGYADAFVAQVRSQVRRNKVDPARVDFEVVHWADVLHDRELALWGRMEEGGKLRYDELRRFIISAFGDAVAYQRTAANGPDDTYHRIHRQIHAHLAALGARTGGDKPLVAIAHSLGTAMLSNYIWDEQHGHGYGQDPFTRLKTLTGLVTFGSTLPLFTLPHDPVVPIRFPAEGLPPHLRAAARWINLYDPDDVLGWPLRSINEAYREVVTEDRAVEVGSLLRSFTPLSHVHYWTDEDVVWPVARLIADVVKAAPGPAP